MKSRQILDSVGRAVQLAVFMLVFATLCGGLLTPFMVEWMHGYDHGRGETEVWLLACTSLGALVGVWLYLLNRKY